MKILVVCQHFYPENFRINDICYELVKRGNDVTVLTGLPNYPKGKVLKEYKFFKNRNQIINGVKIKRCSLVGRGNSTLMMMINYMWFAIFASIKAMLMKKDFDLVYVYQLSPITMTWPAIVVKKMKKIPLIIHVLDQWPVSVITGGIKKESMIYKILTRISIDSYNYADLITCSSKSFKDYFIDELGLDSDKQFLYLPSYAEDDYNNIVTKKDDTFDLVFAGNIGPAQSVETIIEAANILKENKKIKFHIVGDGLSKKKCEDLAKQYKLKNVIFYGYHPVEEMPKYYQMADAFLITMVDNEVVNSTLPAKVQSYMMAGKPIIGAISGEVSSVISEAKCGLTCSSLDYKNLSKIIEKSSANKDLDTWGKNAYKYYLEHFDKNKCIDDLENVFKETINNGCKYNYSSNIAKFIKYCLISVASLILDLTLFTIFNKHIVNRLINNNVIIVSTILARIISSFFNYKCNQKITFKSNAKNTMLKYYILCITQMMISGILVQKIYKKLLIEATVIKFFVDLLIFVANYIIQKKLIFKESDQK